MTLVVLATGLLASGTAVSNADQASELNVDVHSSNVLATEDTRFLRSHQITDDKVEINEHGEEERMSGSNLFSALKLEKMGRDTSYRDKEFQRWKNYGNSVGDVTPHVPVSLKEAYATYLRIREMVLVND
ncbi:secreted RxLR effector peptide protein, putative [Phytophthora infestans T30-4]|uniref:RxLR effector protein SFI6 n=2 Tax=Phytophthora infestans TaxID=4787 RepID=SFI6_PHYIT|nr:secreted RxLR effector peptide protein, putative [Phytophthora infestans T30-4]D0NN72.1 RecName: Full=RxLR effector protein SFI6; AltName: Full=Suppressor of early Flg22-induced immune response 6; Flags: Precursor [Phytophthora infestans T30-4]EEY61979.1 secreted RxLR effector peptide protein, putative [Phytophthora infestans T30-4]|eukprot:XP_002899619.1 secreted RxLR effector peptide protein, putative [Phytophthora infestans T30-4]